MADEAKPITNLEKIHAKDIMTEDVEVIKENMLIGQIAHLMLRNRISGYPVVNENKEVIGIITIKDLFVLIDKIADDDQRLSMGENRYENLHDKIEKCKDRKVSEIMSRNVITITPDTTLGEIIETVVKWRIHTFPVMEDNKLVGIIGRHDVLNATFVYG